MSKDKKKLTPEQIEKLKAAKLKSTEGDKLIQK